MTELACGCAKALDALWADIEAERRVTATERSWRHETLDYVLSKFPEIACTCAVPSREQRVAEARRVLGWYDEHQYDALELDELEAKHAEQARAERIAEAKRVISWWWGLSNSEKVSQKLVTPGQGSLCIDNAALAYVAWAEEQEASE